VRKARSRTSHDRTPSPTETQAALWEYDIRAARVSAMARKTGCGESPQWQGI